MVAPRRSTKAPWTALLAVALLTPLLALGTVSVAADTVTPTFSDVPVTHPFFTEIEWGAAQGVIGGYPDGTFRPTIEVTRQALAAFLYRLAGFPAFTPPTTPTFPDVPVTHPFFTEIEWGAARGVIGGYDDGTFKPARFVTRQAHAAMLYRLAGEPTFTPPGTPSFVDVATTHPFFVEIEWGAQAGLINGYPGDVFRPTFAVRRQATAAFVYRFAHLVMVPGFGPNRQLSHAEVNEYLGDLVAADGPDGSVHVLWKESDQLLYRKTDADGNTLVRTVHLGFTPVLSRAYGLSHPALAPLPDGGVVVFWRYQGATDPGIYAARLDPAGRTAVAPRLLRAGYFSALEAGADGAGVVHLVAQEDRLTTSASSTITDRIMYLRLDGDLGAVRPWQYLTTRFGSQNTVYPELLVEADGTAHIAWFDDRFTSKTSYFDLLYAQVSPGGVVTGPVQVTDLVDGTYVPPSDDPGDWGPELALAPDGTLRIVWGSTFGRVFLATLTASGTPIVHNRLLVDDTDPVISGLGFGLAATTHEDGDTSVFAATGSPTMAAFRVDEDGDLQTAPFRMALGTGQWGHPFLTTAGSELQVTMNHDLGTGYDRVVTISTGSVGDATDRPDLLVDDAHSSNVSTPDPPVVGTSVTLSVEVTNAGFVPSPATTAELRFEGDLIGTAPVPALAVEAHATVQATWPVPADLPASPAAIEVTVDPGDTISETTEANNVVEHLVPVNLPPEGATVMAVGWDETHDPSRDGIDVVNGFTATLAGTTTDGSPYSTDVTASASHNRALFPDPVPPGSYTLSATADGYATPEPVPLTVTRNPLDLYDITVTPSALPELWFNTWGDIDGEVVTAIGSVGIAGATVTDRTSGRTTTSGADGSFTFADLAAGEHRLDIEADGRARVAGLPVAVEVGGVATPTVPMATTTVGYLDVQVDNGSGTPVVGALVELRNASDSTTLDSCYSNTVGRCSFEPVASQSYRVRASTPGYLPATSDLVTLTAGRTTVVDVGLELDVGAVTWRSSGLLGWSTWAEDFSVPLIGNADYYTFYGNFATTFDLAYQDVGTQRYVQGLDVEIKGNPYYLTVLVAKLDINVGSPVKLPLYVVIPTLSANVTNVRVDEVRIVDTATHDVLWPTTGVQPPSPVYSHTADGEHNAFSTLPGVPVLWPDIAVELDVKIGKAVPGEVPGFAPALELGGADELTITWIPATNETVVRNSF